MTLARVINLLDINRGGSNLEYGILLDGKNFNQWALEGTKVTPNLKKSENFGALLCPNLKSG